MNSWANWVNLTLIGWRMKCHCWTANGLYHNMERCLKAKFILTWKKQDHWFCYVVMVDAVAFQLYDLRKTGYIGREEVLWIHPLPCGLRDLWTMLYWFSPLLNCNFLFLSSLSRFLSSKTHPNRTFVVFAIYLFMRLDWIELGLRLAPERDWSKNLEISYMP